MTELPVGKWAGARGFKDLRATPREDIGAMGPMKIKYAYVEGR